MDELKPLNMTGESNEDSWLQIQSFAGRIWMDMEGHRYAEATETTEGYANAMDALSTLRRLHPRTKFRLVSKSITI